MKVRTGVMILVFLGGFLVGCAPVPRKDEASTLQVKSAPKPEKPSVAQAAPASAGHSQPVATVKKRVPIPDAVSSNPGLSGELNPGTPEPGEITSVDIEQLFLLKGDGKALAVDVRPSVFFAMGHIDGAISLPLKTFASAYPKKKPDLQAAVSAKKVIVLYCADVNCPDGYAVARKLAADGYSVSLYKGGWAEWKAAGLE